jgi:hypothetical protein
MRRAADIVVLALAGLLVAGPALARAQSFVVALELWDRPRSAAALTGQTAVREAVRAWLTHSDGRIVVHHGPGAEAYAQAEELRTWLIALAVEGERVLLRGDPAAGPQLRLEVLRD